MAYTKYSLTPANNTATPPDGAPEGMLPSAVNDTMRDMMAQIRDCGDGIRDGTYTMTAPKITGGTITGSTINNSAIGATTASTGAFSTLSATGATTFSGATVVSGSLTANTFSSSGATITGGSVSGITDLAIADGGTGASTAAAARTNLGLDGFVNMKNRIINGAMVIDQRNAGAVTTPTNGQYFIDRYYALQTTAGKFTTQLSSTAPSGFASSLLCTSTSAFAVGAGDIFGFAQKIEAYNTSDLMWGTASAKTITLSFQVYSSLTGTFGGALQNGAQNYSYPFTYSIPVANTWTTISVTIAGPTAGTWISNTNGTGLVVFLSVGTGTTNSGTAGAWTGTGFYSATGAVSVVGTNGATFYITGVQFEVGSTATSFDYRPYTTELQLCQRYLPAFTPNGSTGIVGQGQMWNNTTTFYTYFTFQTTTRVPPTGITVSSLSHFKGNGVSTDVTSLSAITVDATTVNGATIRGVGTGGTANQCTGLIAINASAQLLLTGCEL